MDTSSCMDDRSDSKCCCCCGRSPSSSSSSFSSSASSSETVAEWVEYERGDLPVVVTVPHGGYLLPEQLLDRTSGCMEHDHMSQELARELQRALRQAVAKRRHPDLVLPSSSPPTTKTTENQGEEGPYLVLNRVNRKKVDMNRDRKNAREEGDHRADELYRLYHFLALTAVRECVRRFGFVHLLDIHGQSHRTDVHELGYLLSTDDLELSDNALDQETQLLSKSSLAGLVRWRARIQKTVRLSEVLRGEASLGSFLERRGVVVVPSPSKPSPLEPRTPYFYGAFTTKAYSQLHCFHDTHFFDPLGKGERPVCHSPLWKRLRRGVIPTTSEEAFPTCDLCSILKVQAEGSSAVELEEDEGEEAEESWRDWVSSTQVESTLRVRSDPELRQIFAGQLAEAILDYLCSTYQFSLAGEGARESEEQPHL